MTEKINLDKKEEEKNKKNEEDIKKVEAGGNGILSKEQLDELYKPDPEEPYWQR